ncbi:unnamed protein product [Nesidiocoris tenuis]|uniref:Uncharacterized protein n=1 Tax=Nesidiocoris tenuis TaxID=355587 RepID=A0A6H5GWW0_9HEMI|nr:unnamed protein product [Nesidiocoris tenuis]
MDGKDGKSFQRRSRRIRIRRRQMLLAGLGRGELFGCGLCAAEQFIIGVMTSRTGRRSIVSALLDPAALGDAEVNILKVQRWRGQSFHSFERSLPVQGNAERWTALGKHYQ